jgi:hypothetical protein
VHLTTGRIAAWVVAALAVGVGAFFVGDSSASNSEPSSVQAADGPHAMTLPKLTAVVPLPSMKKPPEAKPTIDREAATEEAPATAEVTAGESFSEVEIYEGPVEETSSAPEESTGSSGEAATPTAQEPAQEPTEAAPSGGGEKLVPEG